MQMLTDPVCGKRIKRERAHIAIDYQHVTYYLCCPRCQADFERAPEKFARAELGVPTRHHATRGKIDRRAGEVTRGESIVRGPRGNQV
jgi:YHS domain-containing protein